MNGRRSDDKMRCRVKISQYHLSSTGMHVGLALVSDINFFIFKYLALFLFKESFLFNFYSSNYLIIHILKFQDRFEGRLKHMFGYSQLYQYPVKLTLRCI
jgi:hypothetical protein